MILYMTIDQRVALIRSEGNVFYAAIGGLYSWATYANDVMVYARRLGSVAVKPEGRIILK